MIIIFGRRGVYIQRIISFYVPNTSLIVEHFYFQWVKEDACKFTSLPAYSRVNLYNNVFTGYRIDK